MNSNLSYSPETPNLGQIRRFLEPCDLEIWRMTLKNNRAPFLSNINLYASFHHHMWIQTWVTVREWLSWVVTSVTLTFDLWSWSFARTLLWSLVITIENFMMIQWREHSKKGVTDRQTDRRADGQYHLQSCLVAANNKSNCTAPDKIKQDSGPLFTKRFDVLTQDLEAARFGFNCSNRSKIWQTPQQQHCRDACQNFRTIWSL